ncbi:phosphoribosylanthranilate isomerase [Carboxylicivirga sediminis]|uniref:N-(5'-phosphoribosyl)anthranilate isomerase n=1 Tax=Carboxylicivirga sediminis TaxID=2006564 RepID=A0A941F4V6_9BACT|nr:phosphoribosylanthranilate isomerase [Carboxylicivirga sediminis]MBR8536482.1 phosphoribosylanthranilate isomerase [Carboxylicivirga sediminis]
MNPTPEIKVCGMRDSSNLQELIELKPDYIGFIFYEKSPRYVQKPPQVHMDASIKKVGVFVNASERTINEKRIAFGLDIIQLHGDESPELCFILKQSGAQVMKAFRIDESFDFQQTRRYQDYCDYFLFDTQTKAFGGSGQKFNWQLLTNYNNARPVFLSGGIGPDDVADIQQLENLNLKAIDINSKFEIKPALKDIPLLSEFFNAIRQIKHEQAE